MAVVSKDVVTNITFSVTETVANFLVHIDDTFASKHRAQWKMKCSGDFSRQQNCFVEVLYFSIVPRA